MNIDRLLLVTTFIVTVGSNAVLFSSSIYLFFKTRMTGFAFLAAGFGCRLMEFIALWLVDPSVIQSYSKYMSLIYPLSMILMVIGFFKLVLAKFSPNSTDRLS